VVDTRQLWLLAGGNGAGKSTFYQTQLPSLGLPIVNADMIAKELYPDAPEEHSYDAARIAEEMRYGLLREGRSFCFETVFSHTSKIDFVAHAKALGYQVILIFIHLEPVDLNKARISQRLESGGHHVPDEKVEQRIPRLLNHIKTVIPLCDQVRIFDNSSARNPFVPVMTIRDGAIEVQQRTVPEWAKNFLT